MFGKLFDIENPVMRFLSDLFDLMVLNIITIVLCIPVVTAAPALTALHYMTLKMARGEHSYLFAPYFKSFKQNLKQSFVIGIIFLAAGAVMYIDWRVIWGMQDLFPQAVRILFTAAMILVIMLMFWVIPLQAHFENPIRVTMRNSVIMSIGNFPRTLAMVAIWIVPIIMLLLSYSMWPVVFMFGLSAPAFACGKVYSPVFKRYEPEEEETAADEAFEMRDEDLDAFVRQCNHTLGDEDTKEN